MHLDILRRARALLAAGWNREHYAVTGDGETCDWRDDRAASFCSIGAIRRAAYELGAVSAPGADPIGRAALAVCYAVEAPEHVASPDGEHAFASPVDRLVYWNDTSSAAAQVLAGFDAAIERCAK